MKYIKDLTCVSLEDSEAEDQEAVIKLTDAMIIKNKVEGAITPFQKKAS